MFQIVKGQRQRGLLGVQVQFRKYREIPVSKEQTKTKTNKWKNKEKIGEKRSSGPLLPCHGIHNLYSQPPFEVRLICISIE